MTVANETIRQVEAPVRGRRLGEILEVLGVVDADDVLLGRYEQEFGDDRQLGEILVVQGLASRAQLDLALELQERTARTSPVASNLTSPEARRVSSASIRRVRNVQSFAMFAVAVAAVIVVVVSSGGGQAGTGWGL